jgi:hypothetical protein
VYFRGGSARPSQPLLGTLGRHRFLVAHQYRMRAKGAPIRPLDEYQV